MGVVERILDRLNDTALAKRFGYTHDEARANYLRRPGELKTLSQYENELGLYYNYHYGKCVAKGGTLSDEEARNRARQIVLQDYRREAGTIMNGFRDAQEGLKTMRAQFDLIAEHLKSEQMEAYVADMLEQVMPLDAPWPAKLTVAREVCAFVSRSLPPSARMGQPEEYVADLRSLARAILLAQRQLAAQLRRR